MTRPNKTGGSASADHRTRPVRVAIYEPYPFPQVAGNLRTLDYLLRFATGRVELLVFVPFESDFTRSLTARGVPCHVVRPSSSVARYGGVTLRDTLTGRMRTALDVLRYNAALGRQMRDLNVDVLYCNGIRAVLMAGIGARMRGIPLLWYIKGALENPLLDRLAYLLANRILFFAPCNRDDYYPWLRRLRGSSVGILPIGMDLTEVAKAQVQAEETRLDRGGAAVCFAFVGQIYPPKGVHHLIEAFQRVVDDGVDGRLFIFGHPIVDTYRPYEEELRNQVARSGLGDRVVFEGWRADVLSQIAQVDVVVHPSLAEGFGRAVLEAMALGRPVVACAVGGLRDTIISGHNGFLVSPGDVAGLALRMTELAQDADLRRSMGLAARRTVEENHRIEDKVATMCDEWFRLAGTPEPEPVEVEEST